jgi:hypothetical protein
MPSHRFLGWQRSGFIPVRFGFLNNRADHQFIHVIEPVESGREEI